MVFAPIWAANGIFAICILNFFLTYGRIFNFAPLPEHRSRRSKGSESATALMQATAVFSILVLVPTFAFEMMLFENTMGWTTYSFVEVFMPLFVVQGLPWALAGLALAGIVLYGC